MSRMKLTLEAIEYLHPEPVTVLWSGQFGEHIVTGQLYRHVGMLMVAGRRVSWLLDHGAVFVHPDPAWLASALPTSAPVPVAA